MSFAVLTRDNRSLAPFCKPYPDELLSSWLTRMAFYQGLSTHELDKLIWAQNSRHIDIDQFITDRRLQVLEEKTGCSFGQLHAASLRSYDFAGCKSMMTAPVLEARIYYDEDKKKEVTQLLYRSGLMFCPNCLKKNNYFKKEWRLTISLVCLVCQCYLQDRCPHCLRYDNLLREPNTYPQCNSLAEFLTSCRYCHKDITKGTTNYAEQPVITLQRQLYAVLETDRKCHSFKCSYFTVLLNLAAFLQADTPRAIKIKDFVSNIMEVNGFSRNLLCKYTEKMTKLSPQKRMPFLSMAQWLMGGWPYRLLSMCMDYRLHWRDILPGIMRENASLRDPLVDDLAYRIEEMAEIADPQVVTESDLPTRDRNIKKPSKFNYDYDYDFDSDTYYYDNEDKDHERIMSKIFTGQTLTMD